MNLLNTIKFQDHVYEMGIESSQYRSFINDEKLREYREKEEI